MRKILLGNFKWNLAKKRQSSMTMIYKLNASEVVQKIDVYNQYCYSIATNRALISKWKHATLKRVVRQLNKVISAET